MPLPHDPGPHWGEVGIHGLHRQREWDAVATLVVPGSTGSESRFVVLADGRSLVEEGDGDADSLRAAVTLAPPYRAQAVCRGNGLWVVGATQLETAELLDDPGGDTVEVSWDGQERTVRIDGRPTLRGVPELEGLGAVRHDTYVVTAARLDGRIWEISVAPL